MRVVRVVLIACVCFYTRFSGNGVGDEGARALAESLKQNTTLTQLNLECMSQFSSGSVFACAR